MCQKLYQKRSYRDFSEKNNPADAFEKKIDALNFMSESDANFKFSIPIRIRLQTPSFQSVSFLTFFFSFIYKTYL